MLTTIRQADSNQDYQALSALLSTFRPEPFTPAELRETDQERQTNGFIERHIAENTSGELIGYGGIEYDHSWKSNSVYVWVLVPEGHRQQTIGSQLAQLVMQRAQELGAQELFTDLKDDNPITLKFAQKHGFEIRNHIFESKLNIAEFDVAEFKQVLDDIAEQGVEIKSLADLGNTENIRRQLYDVNYAVAMDIPDRTNDFLSWSDFQTKIIGSEWFDPTTQLLAMHQGEAIGIHALRHVTETNSMYNLITGVRQAYRGRKIAQALKLAGILIAKERNITYIRTHNHSKNKGMLAINAKLGFEPEVGYYDLVKTLS